MRREVAEFVIYVINEVATCKGCSTSEVYRALVKANGIQGYLVPFYDVLHTMDSRIVVEDVFKYLKKQGVAL